MRQTDAILAAAVRCLARDGYSASSISKIAAEAGVQKRMVLYYFGSREVLFDAVVQRIGDQLLAQLEEALEGLEDPVDIVSVGFDQIWGHITSDRALLAAYFGLVTESVTDPHLRKSVGYINEGYRRLIRKLAADMATRGRRLAIDEQALTVLIVAGIQGLTLEFLERGDTPALRSAIEVFQAWLGSVARPMN
jgi:AcrR family transcriptional regulator